MLMNELAGEIHRNAEEHGWWDEDRSIYQIAALIHSEWSEALEEARAGRPAVYKLDIDGTEPRYLTPDDPAYAASWEKPEGVAVELADGCIRILDLLGFLGADIVNPESEKPAEIEDILTWTEGEDAVDDVGTLVCMLHKLVSDSVPDEPDEDIGYLNLMAAMGVAIHWINKHGIDPIQLIMEKHRYNKTRPYKHGKLF